MDTQSTMAIFNLLLISLPNQSALIETTTKEDARLDNSGNGPLRVPGFGGRPVGLELVSAERFAHGLTEQGKGTRRNNYVDGCDNDLLRRVEAKCAVF